MPFDATDGAPEHVLHVAGLQMPEPLPDALATLLVPGASEAGPEPATHRT